MRRVDDFWRNYLEAMTSDELRAFRDEHHLEGGDLELDHVLDSGRHGKVLVQCLEWEG